MPPILSIVRPPSGKMMERSVVLSPSWWWSVVWVCARRLIWWFICWGAFRTKTCIMYMGRSHHALRGADKLYNMFPLSTTVLQIPEEQSCTWQSQCLVAQWEKGRRAANHWHRVATLSNKVTTLITPGLNQDPDDTHPLPDYRTITWHCQSWLFLEFRN